MLDEAATGPNGNRRSVADSAPARWLVRGYSKDAVEAALGAMRARIEDLELALVAARDAAAVHEQHAADAMELARRIAAREAELDRRLQDGAALTPEQLAAAESRARVIIAEAEAEAARLRAQAHVQVADIGRDIEVLLSVKERTAARVAELRAELAELEGVAGAPAAADPRLSNQVEIHARPLTDFVELTALERSLAAMPGVEDVQVLSFDAETAVVSVSAGLPLSLEEVRRNVRRPGAVAALDDRTVTIDLTIEDPDG